MRLVARVRLHVLREHRLAAVVPVSGPVQNLEPAGLLREVRTRGSSQSGSSGDQSGAAGDGCQLEQVFTAEPPLPVALSPRPSRRAPSLAGPRLAIELDRPDAVKRVPTSWRERVRLTGLTCTHERGSRSRTSADGAGGRRRARRGRERGGRRRRRGARLLGRREPAHRPRRGRIHARPPRPRPARRASSTSSSPSPGLGLEQRELADMDRVDVDFSGGSTQVFHIGAASCAVPGARDRARGSAPLVRLAPVARPLRARDRARAERRRAEQGPGVPARDPRPDPAPHTRVARRVRAQRRAPRRGGHADPGRPRRHARADRRARAARSCTKASSPNRSPTTFARTAAASPARTSRATASSDAVPCARASAARSTSPIRRRRRAGS